MNVSKKTLAVIRKAALYQLWNGSGALNEDIVQALERIMPRKEFDKFSFASLGEIQYELQQIGKSNKRKKAKP
ncbi:MAG: hypothetical protein CV087_08255 [Candidatus Brocadia sp. WS118]|nr:MAG: hypothetical protein CV087_08255 [Candidatus Brocadia sp. WS118]